MCGRLQAVKGFSHVAASVGAAMCSAFLCGSHKAAGHNAFRGSGPGQKLAFDNAVAQVGCPDRRIDQSCITCCLPHPTVHLRRRLARSRLYRRRLLSRKRDRLLVTLALGHHRPGHSGELVGKRNRRNLGRPASHQRCQPGPVLGAMLLRIFDDCERADAEERSQIAVASLRDIAELIWACRARARGTVGGPLAIPGVHNHWRSIGPGPAKAALPGGVLLSLPTFAFGSRAAKGISLLAAIA